MRVPFHKGWIDIIRRPVFFHHDLFTKWWARKHLIAWHSNVELCSALGWRLHASTTKAESFVVVLWGGGYKDPSQPPPPKWCATPTDLPPLPNWCLSESCSESTGSRVLPTKLWFCTLFCVANEQKSFTLDSCEAPSRWGKGGGSEEQKQTWCLTPFWKCFPPGGCSHKVLLGTGQYSAPVATN